MKPPNSIGWIHQSQCETVVSELEKRGEVVKNSRNPSRRLLPTQRFQQLKERLIARCQTELERRRPASFVPLSVVLSAMKRHASPAVLDALLLAMAEKREIVRRENRIGLSSGPELSNRQRNTLTALTAEVSAAGPTPPSIKEFAERHGHTLKDLEPIVQVAVDEGQFVRLRRRLSWIEVRSRRCESGWSIISANHRRPKSARFASSGALRGNTPCRFSSSSMSVRLLRVKATFVRRAHAFRYPVDEAIT